MDLIKRIQNLAGEIHGEVVEKRHHLHQNPELSFEERQTAAFVQAELEALGIPCTPGIGGHGLVGLITGSQGRSSQDSKIVPVNPRTIALRADMDALPIEEANEVPYKSRNAG